MIDSIRTIEEQRLESGASEYDVEKDSAACVEERKHARAFDEALTRRAQLETGFDHRFDKGRPRVVSNLGRDIHIVRQPRYTVRNYGLRAEDVPPPAARFHDV